jgi:hypothetical protein
MTNRREFLGLLAAVAVQPRTPEAPRCCVQVRTASGAWRTLPTGLLAIRTGQRFRLCYPETGACYLEATAMEDGHPVLDAEGKRCGGVKYDSDTAVTV